MEFAVGERVRLCSEVYVPVFGGEGALIIPELDSGDTGIVTKIQVFGSGTYGKTDYTYYTIIWDKNDMEIGVWGLFLEPLNGIEMAHEKAKQKQNS